MFRDTICLVLLCCLSLWLDAQQKYEKESDLKLNEVPVRALDFINSANLGIGVNWYHEENLKGNSIEAKFTYHDHHYSVEFDVDGGLQDIEIEHLLTELNRSIITVMSQNLEKEFKKFTILRLQIQYSGGISSLAEFLTHIDQGAYEVRYETEVKAKKTKRMKLYEILFDADGTIERIDEIILRNNDYLEY